MERNTSSSDAVEPSSDLDPDSETFSKSLCDDLVAAESVSKGCDIASFRVQERWQVSAACIVPLSFVPGEFRIRMLQMIREKLY